MVQKRHKEKKETTTDELIGIIENTINSCDIILNYIVIKEGDPEHIFVGKQIDLESLIVVETKKYLETLIPLLKKIKEIYYKFTNTKELNEKQLDKIFGELENLQEIEGNDLLDKLSPKDNEKDESIINLSKIYLKKFGGKIIKKVYTNPLTKEKIFYEDTENSNYMVGLLNCLEVISLLIEKLRLTNQRVIDDASRLKAEDEAEKLRQIDFKKGSGEFDRIKVNQIKDIARPHYVKNKNKKIKSFHYYYKEKLKIPYDKNAKQADKELKEEIETLKKSDKGFKLEGEAEKDLI